MIFTRFAFMCSFPHKVGGSDFLLFVASIFFPVITFACLLLMGVFCLLTLRS